ncbi:hypothetical protein [Methylocapsa acidiphila]|uniref:hypothetical protein n=1 Tax=Methylocapsa acidiphila TaxID=133552 RepID=UPI0012EC2276|nr:hypothetical protein [Methylocapsa acidiphila]
MAAFSDLLQEEYGFPIEHWAGAEGWSDFETARIWRALEVLMKHPIAEAERLTEEDRRANELGAGQRWILSDHKIAGADFEASWQWRLFAAIDNAAKSSQGGQMMTPSDPRLFLLRMRYEREFLAPLAEYLLEFLCDRPSFPPTEAAAFGHWPAPALDQAEALRKIPGFEEASQTFVVGLLFMISRMGTKSFCDWCADHC